MCLPVSRCRKIRFSTGSGDNGMGRAAHRQPVFPQRDGRREPGGGWARQRTPPRLLTLSVSRARLHARGGTRQILRPNRTGALLSGRAGHPPQDTGHWMLAVAVGFDGGVVFLVRIALAEIERGHGVGAGCLDHNVMFLVDGWWWVVVWGEWENRGDTNWCQSPAMEPGM